MAVKRTYTGHEPVYYPTLGVHAEPGAEVDFDHAADVPTDGAWSTDRPEKKVKETEK